MTCQAQLQLPPEMAGRRVLVTSQIGLVGHTRGAAYGASKAGLDGMVRALALERLFQVEEIMLDAGAVH